MTKEGKTTQGPGLGRQSSSAHAEKLDVEKARKPDVNVQNFVKELLVTDKIIMEYLKRVENDPSS